jgi:SAM-dependent methyltransferase
VPVNEQISRESRTTEGSRAEARGLEFGQYYFAHDCGVPYEYNEYWTRFFAAIADRIVADLNPSSVLDAGCAIGMLVEALRGRGVDAYGIDVSDWAMANLAPGAVGHCRKASLAEPIQGQYDLVTCIEVIEHIPEPDASSALENMCAATDRILLSSSPFDYAEPTHVNVRSAEDWAVSLARRGFLHNLNFDASFITPWAVLYERTESTVPSLVQSYERALFRLNLEVTEVRATVLSLQGRLEDLVGAGEGEELAKLRHQVYESRQDLLARRDQLIGLEGQLAEALGKAHELELELWRYQHAVEELELFRRSAVWRLYESYVRLRGRSGRLVRAITSRLG